MTGDEAVARARALLGVRFRPQGRDPDYGLDCIGVIVATFALRGIRRDYRLRWGDADGVVAGLASAGFVPAGTAEPGDLLAMRAGPGQLHLAIVTPVGFLHADASLRRVVEVPGPPAWPVLGVWRHLEPAHDVEG